MLHSTDIYGLGGNAFKTTKKQKTEIAKSDSNYRKLKKYVGSLGKSSYFVNKQASKEIPATFGDLLEPYKLAFNDPSTTPNKVGDSSLTGHALVDLKMVDVDQSALFRYNFTAQLLNGPITQGDDINQRLANRIVMKELDLMYSVIRGPISAGIPNWCRIIIAYDKFGESVLPKIDAYVGTVLDVNTYLYPMDPNLRARWITLYDKMFVVSRDFLPSLSFLKLETNHHTSSMARVKIDFTKTKYGPLTTLFSDSGGTVTSIVSGAIFIWFLSDGNSSRLPTANYYSRITYQNFA